MVAELARASQHCARAPLPRTAVITGRDVNMPRQRGGLVELADIRAQAPLPETADELCTVGRSLASRTRPIRPTGHHSWSLGRKRCISTSCDFVHCSWARGAAAGAATDPGEEEAGDHRLAQGSMAP